MQPSESSPMLADAADVLSDQLRLHLRRMAKLLKPHTPQLERRFTARLRELGFNTRQREELISITPGAAARTLTADENPLKLFEDIEYHGRRLAKLNVPPGSIVQALQEYDRLLTPALRKLIPNEYEDFKWVREQLHFCVVLTLNNAFYQVREAETQAFYELFRAELESKSLDELLRRLLETLRAFANADASHLFLLNDEYSAWELKSTLSSGAVNGNAHERKIVSNSAALLKRLSVLRRIDLTGESDPALLDRRWATRYKTCCSIPLAVAGRTAGVIQFGFAKPYEWLPREQELLAAAAERCLMAAEKARLLEDLASREDQIRQLAEHMLHVEEVERRRVSRELHDEAGQSLLCIRLQLELMEEGFPQGPIRARLAETRKVTEHTIVEIRRLIAALSPAVLEQLGLGAALRQLVVRFRRLHPCRVKLQLTRLGQLPQKTEIIVYRLVQECCNNVAKHSFATHLNISLSSTDGVLRLIVEDDGVGFHVQEALARRDSFGLSGMMERVALLGGRCSVQSWPQAKGIRKRGTRVAIELPVPGEQPERPPTVMTANIGS